MTSPVSASLTETQNSAAFSRPKIIVVNVVALRGLPAAARGELLALLNDAAINGARPILSIREHDQGMEEMIAITLPCMIPPSWPLQGLLPGLFPPLFNGHLISHSSRPILIRSASAD